MIYISPKHSETVMVHLFPQHDNKPFSTIFAEKKVVFPCRVTVPTKMPMHQGMNSFVVE